MYEPKQKIPTAKKKTFLQSHIKTILTTLREIDFHFLSNKMRLRKNTLLSQSQSV